MKIILINTVAAIGIVLASYHLFDKSAVPALVGLFLLVMVNCLWRIVPER